MSKEIINRYMLKKDAVKYIYLVRDLLLEQYPFLKADGIKRLFDKIEFDKNEKCGFGVTYNGVYGVSKVKIGTLEIENTKTEIVSEYDFMKVIEAEFHEVVGHCQMIRYDFKKDNELTNLLALNHYGCKTSSAYYEGDNYYNYFRQPHEIAAQYLAIKNSKEFLSILFDEEKAEQLIVDYVNNRIIDNSEFIEFKDNLYYKSVEDILTKYQDTFCDRAYEHRMFNYKSVMNEKCLYMDYLKNGHFSKFIKLSNHKNGMKQDSLMSSIFVSEMDKGDYLRDKIPVFGSKYFLNDSLDPNIYPDWMTGDKKNLNLDLLIDDSERQTYYGDNINRYMNEDSMNNAQKFDDEDTP